MNGKNLKGLAYPAVVLGGDTPPAAETPSEHAESPQGPPSGAKKPSSVAVTSGAVARDAMEPLFVPLDVDPALNAAGSSSHLRQAGADPGLANGRPSGIGRSPARGNAGGPREIALPLWARWAYPGAAVLAAVWAALLIAFCLAYRDRDGPFEYTPFPAVVFGSLALLPGVFMLLGAFVLRQAARLSLETTRARALAEDLAIPAALAADQAGGAAEAVRREVARATEAGEAAERQLLSLRRSLAEESNRLIAATEAAERVARTLTDSLARERTSMTALSSTLELQMGSMNDVLERQTHMVGETSDLAAIQLQEAQAALAARTADLTTIVAAVSEAAEVADDSLCRQTGRLDAVGALVGERLETLTERLGHGRGRLAELAALLEADQQTLADRLEAQRQTAEAVASETYESLRSVADSADDIGERLRDLVAEAEDRLRSAGQAIQGEQAALEARARAGLTGFRDAVTEERRAIELEARTALADLAMTAAQQRRTAAEDLAAAEGAVAAQAEAARAQVEQLGQVAFEVGQKVDQAFDHRISTARRTIEQSAALVEEAGRQSVGRIDAGLAAVKSTLLEVEAMLASVDDRVATLPSETQVHANAIRASVEASLEALSANARRIAAEGEAMDVALQGRVRRNYEMLADALKTMGKVAEVTERAAQTVIQPAAPTPAPATPALSPADVSVAAALADEADPLAQPTAAPATPSSSREPITVAAEMRAPASGSDRPSPYRTEAETGENGPREERASLRPAAPASNDAGLRPRLRLTAESDSALPRPATAPARPNPFSPSRSQPGPSSMAPSAPVRASMSTAFPPRTGARPERPPPVTHETLDPFIRTSPTAAGRRDLLDDTPTWTWKDLLASIDEPPIDDEVLAERLISEIESLGLDAASLLPLAQIDSIAVAMQKGDAEGVRGAVRALAPGAVRRLSRRVMTDKVLRAQADRYVRRYEDLIHDSAKRDREGFMTAALLGSEPGRAFLLFDAAVGELH